MKGYDLSALWSTVGTMAPVLALALVVEARATASRWSNATKGARRLEAFVFLFIAVLLSMAMVFSLVALAGASVSPRLVIVTILVAFFLLAFSPIYYMFVKSNLDLYFQLSHLMPWSSWRKNRRQIAQFKERVSEAIIRTDQAIELATQAVKSARRDLNISGLLPDTALEWSNDQFGTSEFVRKSIDGAPAGLIPRLETFVSRRDSLVDAYDRSPSPEIAHELRKLWYSQAREALIVGRASRAEILRLSEQLVASEQTKVRQLTPEELLSFETTLKNIGRPGLF